MRFRVYLSLAFVVIFLSPFVYVPGRPVQAQAEKQKSQAGQVFGSGATVREPEHLRLVKVIPDVRKLPQATLDRHAVSKGKPFLVPDRDLQSKFKASRSNDEINAKVTGAAAAGSAPPQASTGAGPRPNVVGTRFNGLSQNLACGGCEPPDTQVGAGPNFLFETVNTTGLITDKAGNVQSIFDLHFFTLPGIFISDPKVRYDPLSDRWFFTIISTSGAADGSGLWFLAVSVDSNPFSWFLYAAEGLVGTFPDFPGLGISDDKVVITANAFQLPVGGPFVASELFVINKADLEAGSGAPNAVFFFDNRFFTVQPGHSLSATGGPLFMASSDFGSSSVYHVFTVNGTPPGPVVIPFADVPLDPGVGNLIIPPNAAQAGTPNLINTGDNRVLDVAYRNRLWVTANDGCFTPSFTSCVRFTEIDPIASTTLQDFDFGEVNGNFYYAAIQIVPDTSFDCGVGDDVVAVFTESNAGDFASAVASGRKDMCDPLNTFRSPAIVRAGQAPYFGGRWGDYSGAGLDPVAGAVWVAGEFTLADSEWGTVISNVFFSGGL